MLRPVYNLTTNEVKDSDVRDDFTIGLPETHPQHDTHFGVKADEEPGSDHYSGRLVPKTEVGAFLSRTARKTT